MTIITNARLVNIFISAVNLGPLTLESIETSYRNQPELQVLVLRGLVHISLVHITICLLLPRMKAKGLLPLAALQNSLKPIGVYTYS